MLNMDTMLAVTERHIAGETEFEVLNLSPGARYKARVAAENKVGLGPFSNYTKVCLNEYALMSFCFDESNKPRCLGGNSSVECCSANSYGFN